MMGRVVASASRFSGTSTVGVEAVGQTVISLDNLNDFATDMGALSIGGDIVFYNAVDRVNSTLTLTAPLTEALPAGTEIKSYPYSIQRWVFVRPDSIDVSDAIWAIVPHALSAFIRPDGLREEDEQEQVKMERDGTTMIVVDVLNDEPFINPTAIPDGAITETKIEPGSITTPLLAANAVATQHLQAGSVTAGIIDSDALNGKVITGALVRSAATGRRVELSASGLVQIDENGAVILSIGDQNKFTGSIDATNMIIRDGLELYGKNNFIKTGAEIILATGQGGSSTPPGLQNIYEVGASLGLPAYSQAVGVFADLAETAVSCATNFFSFSSLRRGTSRYTFPTVTRSDGTGVGSIDIQAMTKIKSASGERAVIVAYRHSAGEAPDTLSVPLEVQVYDDTVMNSSGTQAPSLKTGVSFTHASSVSFFRTIALGKVWGAAGLESLFSMADLISDGTTATITLQTHQVVNDTTRTVTNNSTASFPLTSSDERVVGVAFGTLGAMKFLPSGHAQAGVSVWVVMTTHKNLIWSASDLSPTGRYTGLEWPVTPSTQFRAFTMGDINNSSSFGRFANIPNGANTTPDSTQKIIRYSNSTWDGTENPIWAQFAWKGDVSKSSPEWLTSPSTVSVPLQRVKRARVQISVPPLPTPVGGVSAARDVDLDVYSWAYYVGQKATVPARVEMWRQANAPAGNPTTVQNLLLAEALVTSGTNPLLATQGFTTLTPAKIKSSSGAHYFDGDGNLVVKTINSQTMSDTGWITPTLLNSWVHFDARTVQYRLRNGWVQMRGLAKSGVVGTAIFQLPAVGGFRPDARVAEDHFFPAASNALYGTTSVDGATGNVKSISGSNVWVDLSSIGYWAAGA